MSDLNDTKHKPISANTSGSVEPVPQSAAIFELRPKTIKASRRQVRCERPTSKDAKVEIETESQILKTAVTYCCCKGTCSAGFIADHTGDVTFAGHGGIVGKAYLDKADRSLRKLITMMNRSSDVLTVELWALAGVAGSILKDAEEPGSELIDDEMKYLKSFFRMTERICHERYEREWHEAQKSRS